VKTIRMGYELRAPEAGRVELVAGEAREPSAGEVRVRVERCGICGSDLHFFLGRQAPPSVCPGHEISGTVASVGIGTTGWSEGDRVVVEPLERCRKCARCKAGDYHLCSAIQIYGVMQPGGMAESLVVPGYCLHRLPDSVDSEIGALAEPTAVAVHALRLAGVNEDSRVLILGAGTIGLLTAVAARKLGAGAVAITARYPHQRELARRLGCDEVLEPGQSWAGERPNAVIETVGGTATTVADAISAIDAGGTVVITGLFDETPAFDPLTMMMKEARMVSSMVYNDPGEGSDFAIALEILAEQSDALRPVISHSFPMNMAQEAFETAADKSTGAIKVLLRPAEA
jgi:2-desacetyl-2-hydroxyethyl bacteriochlorophyllide A dehydrogenase